MGVSTLDAVFPRDTIIINNKWLLLLLLLQFYCFLPFIISISGYFFYRSNSSFIIILS